VRSRLRPTIRVRLTLLYGALFMVAGVVLLGVTYLLVKWNLGSRGGVALSVADLGVPIEGGRTDARVGQVNPERAQAFVERTQDELLTETLQSLLSQGALALAVVGALAVAFGYLLAERVLRPLHRITDTARRVSGGSLAVVGTRVQRIDLDGPRDEIKELADTFDEMLERLGHAFDSQSRFVANASHELRTPLAINRTLVEVALRRKDATEDARRLGEALMVVNARHERLIDGLLTLARGENAVVSRSPINLRDVATHVLVQAQPEADEAQVAVHSNLAPALTVGDPVLVERLAQNLVENAIRHNQGGGWLQVTTLEGPSGEAELVVANTGPVVPPYEIDALFEPFRRLRADRLGSDRGAGLGLSIVRAVAGSHGGEVRAEPREGGGLIVTVRLPPARPRTVDRARPAT
jgi:signal transduction histidine kinase